MNTIESSDPVFILLSRQNTLLSLLLCVLCFFAAILSFLDRVSSSARDQRGEYLSRAGECAAAVHRDEVIDQCHITALPRNVEGEFVAEFRGDQNRVAVERTSVAEGDGLRRVVAAVLPSPRCGNQLVEERRASVR